jgi:hypothetical protein
VKRPATRVLAATLVAGLISASGALGAGGTHHPHRCARLHTRYGTMVVYVVAGPSSCSEAKSVIRYVSSHGTPTQGSLGKSPRGWMCGYGYGYYRGNRQREGRDGPECSRRSTVVAGVDPAYTPA